MRPLPSYLLLALVASLAFISLLPQLSSAVPVSDEVNERCCSCCCGSCYPWDPDTNDDPIWGWGPNGYVYG
ncbi:hypothetical protein TYRP_011826 [Tyrophagus putrescentiae]|nr:hypothetical protein TYRP_011826 [Tyrophagus putrescentiae]